MSHPLLVLLPPLIVLAVGYFSRKVLLSLLLGILSASLIACHFDLLASIKYVFQHLWTNFELYNLVSISTFWKCKNLLICVFLFTLGAIIALVGYSGGAYAYANFMKKRLRTSTNVQGASLLLSSVLFIDDYFSSLTAGSVMLPLTDSYRIPRAKLAFLVDSMAAPLAILCPFSSWFAAIIGFLTENGVSTEHTSTTLVLESPLIIYLHTIPYILYSFVIMISCMYIVRRRISFGLMRKHEIIAEQTGNLFAGNDHYQNRADQLNNITNNLSKNASLWDFFIPILTFVICIVLGMVYSGGYNPCVNNIGFFTGLQNASVALALFWGGISALSVITLYFFLRRKISLKSTGSLYMSSTKMMFQTMMILMLAWTLGDILRTDLNIGTYLAGLIAGNIQIALLPVLFFLLSLTIAFSTGTSWGTAAVMLPIAIPTTIALLGINTPALDGQIGILFPVIGAVFSGCVAGDHISPISDTTIMSSTSTKMPHIDHVQTQMGYALPLIAITAIGFLICGLTISYGPFLSIGASLLSSVTLALLTLEFLNRRTKEKVIVEF